MTATVPPPLAQDGGLIELTHPGEMLREDFMEPMSLNPSQVAQATGIPLTALSDILGGRHDISAENSLLLDRFFGLSDGYWLRLQTDYSLRQARRVLAVRLTSVRPYAQPRETAA